MCRVSVIMPVYNAEKYISKAIESILKQSFNDFELIIIDDGSKDNSLNIIKSYHDARIVLIENKTNRGVVYSRNIGLEVAKGEYIALMDADDIAPLNRLQREVECLDADNNIDCINGKIIFIDEEDKEIGMGRSPFWNYKYVKASLIFQNVIGNGSTLLRKSTLQKYNIQYRDIGTIITDYMFWSELSWYGHIQGIDEVMQYYRINSVGLTSESKKKERDRIIDEIHMRTYNAYGFNLSDMEQQVLLQATREDGVLNNETELRVFYQALQSLIKQSEDKQLDFCEELRTACRKIFAQKVGKAFYLWENL